MTGRRWLAVLVVACGVLVLDPLGGRIPPPAPGSPPIVVVSQARPPAAAPVAARAGTALTASRAFLAGFLRFVYGRLGAAQLPDASPYLRGQAAGQRPRPPAVVLAAANPRLTWLRLTGEGPHSARAVAVIEDGASAYRIDLALRRRSAGWTVTGLGETG